MGVVAVAGGTGDVGRTIVDQLVLSGKHEVLVLGRKAPKETTPRSPAFAVVDYDHVNETTKLLNERNVDTIISAMSPSTASRQSEIKLIAAAQASSAVKRFIPSEYEGDVLLSLPEEGLSADDTPKRAADALAASDLKFTRIANGIFMDYFGIPNIPSHLAPFIWAIDISSRRAVIPGDGNQSVSLTYSRDVARYIDRLLDEDEWPPVSIMSGSDITLNEMLAVAERVTGDKFDVAHDELSDLKMGKTTPLRPDAPSYQGFDPVAMNAAIGVALVEGQMVLPKNGRLNERFPEVRPMSFEEMVTDAWSRRE